MTLDPLTGHSLGQPSFVDPQPHERPERKPRQGLAPTPTPGRENVGLLERDTPGEAPAPWSALQQPDPTSDLERQIRELTAKNERLNEQIAVLRQGPRPEVDATVTKVRR